MFNNLLVPNNSWGGPIDKFEMSYQLTTLILHTTQGQINICEAIAGVLSYITRLVSTILPLTLNRIIVVISLDNDFYFKVNTYYIWNYTTRLGLIILLKWLIIPKTIGSLLSPKPTEPVKVRKTSGNLSAPLQIWNSQLQSSRPWHLWLVLLQCNVLHCFLCKQFLNVHN